MTPRIQPLDHRPVTPPPETTTAPTTTTTTTTTTMKVDSQSKNSTPRNNTTCSSTPSKEQEEEEIKDLMDQSYEERWSEEKIRHVVQEWKLTAQEEEQLGSLQQSLLDLKDYWKNNPLDVVRYLRGPGKFDMVEAKLREMIAWRKEYGADSLLETYRPPKALLYYVPSAILKGCDKDGDPIYLERGGVMDGIGLQQFRREDIVRHIIWLREIGTRGAWLRDYERRMRRPPSQVTIIYDMQGMSSRVLKHGVIPMFRDIVKINQQRYCGLAKRIILLRAPSVFQFVWNIAKHFFPPEGQKLMVFTTPHNYQAVLDKYIDRSVLPPCIFPKEGRGSAIDEMPQNFEGGMIPLVTTKNTSNNHNTTTTKVDESKIPDEPWIRDMMNYAETRKRRRTKQQTQKPQPLPLQQTATTSPTTTTVTTFSSHDEKNHNSSSARQSSSPSNNNNAATLTLCLSEYRNVKVMTTPRSSSVIWKDEFETVLVR